ncbi:YcxB family protein [Planctobacterium marinum]|uniref:YcxB family protein n=1 Tax=Planctobacterium marinum TaxID=1631968 RepID=UPI001E3AA3C6|nr:YcxB family protein [Planctobacterium marinum]MCC2605773.1 YcxB family protein [Planctobacterium marinum]
MAEAFHYSTTYKLDKSHFSETYDQSVTDDFVKRGYIKALILALVGSGVLLATEISGYIAWFIIGLGGLEALSVRFHKAWWLARQMISKAANNKVTLTIDEEAVKSHSIHVNSKITWQDITKIQQTSAGWLLYLPSGKSYLSNRCLSAQAQEFLALKATEKQ